MPTLRLLKIGKADADDIMPTNGRVRRAHNSLRKVQKIYPNAIMEIIEELGQTTTGKAEAVEAKRVRTARNNGVDLPLNKEKRRSYKANSKPRGKKCT
ncbi:MAG: hypothetical protein Q4B82_08345 [Alysiella sp.]|uniref:hypothetical protein n=1 Tax=Alysiella sp. TaxID=1872483 RepID=UPI0026DDB1BA|nr:hypothetical protein [Alysiella sp.]MDO4434571.1 hypothetical protein [Alysiella sp.]